MKVVFGESGFDELVLYRVDGPPEAQFWCSWSCCWGHITAIGRSHHGSSDVVEAATALFQDALLTRPGTEWPKRCSR